MNEPQAVEQGLTFYQKAQGLVINTPEEYEQSAEMKMVLKSLDKQAADMFVETRPAAYATWQKLCKQEIEYRKPFLDALKIVDAKRTDYYNKQEDIRKAAEARAQKEAEAAAQKERDRLLALAVKAEEKGKDEKAEEFLEKAEAVYVEPVFVSPVVEKTTRLAGGGTISRIKDIEITVTSPLLVLKAVVEGKIPMTCVEISPGAIKKWAKAIGLVEAPAGMGIVIKETSREAVR